MCKLTELCSLVSDSSLQARDSWILFFCENSLLDFLTVPVAMEFQEFVNRIVFNPTQKYCESIKLLFVDSLLERIVKYWLVQDLRFVYLHPLVNAHASEILLF